MVGENITLGRMTRWGGHWKVNEVWSLQFIPIITELLISKFHVVQTKGENKWQMFLTLAVPCFGPSRELFGLLQLNVAKENGSTLNWPTCSFKSTLICNFNFSFLFIPTILLQALLFSCVDSSKNFLNCYLYPSSFSTCWKETFLNGKCAHDILLPTFFFQLSAGWSLSL